MAASQPGILAPLPPLARYLRFRLAPDGGARKALERLAGRALGEEGTVVGLGHAAVSAAGRVVEGLREAKAVAGVGVSVPATPSALWCWLRGDDRGELVHRGRALAEVLGPAFALESVVDAFQYDGGRDLTGYEDGTENPKGKKAQAAALVAGRGRGEDGGSFVAVQLWRHELDRFARFSRSQQDALIGRRRRDNEELAGAPPSAHVKRTAQERFSPQAFVLRRSMPWADAGGEGLVFVAFGRSFDAFEAQLRRMVGAEDGVVDGLFRFTRPLSTSYFWCPPAKGTGLDLSVLGL